MRNLLLSVILLGTLNIALAQNSKEIIGSKQVAQGVQAIDRNSAEAQVRFLASDLLKGRLAGSVENKIAAEYLVSLLCEMGYKPTMQPFVARGGRNMQNILLTIPGQDTTQYTIIGSHYDHLGVRDEQIYNGADDNASGAVAIIQIARAIKASGLKPKRNIMLALWDGEEGGLQGSKYFVANFKDTLAINHYMNFDMIGRNTDESNPEMFRYFYTAAHPEYEQWLREAIELYDLKLKPDYRSWDNPASGSDNASFAKRKIPITWYHTDAHPDYHKPTDTPEKLNWDKMLDIIRSSYLVSWMVANQ